tara:strand:+ start:1789 stop:2046 length:258 start_codon:yes stop_codon:yes gene_type:complete
VEKLLITKGRHKEALVSNLTWAKELNSFRILVREMSVRMRDREIWIEAIELQEIEILVTKHREVSIKITHLISVVRKMMTSTVDQ